MTSTRRRIVPALSLASLALTTVIGTAGAAEAAPKRIISACYNVDTGRIRVVESIADCRPAESHIRWKRGGKNAQQGARGPKGVAGPMGPMGPAGPQGATGATGTPGAAGAPGAPGAIGPVGATGPAGATGATGPAGDTGAAGATGATGPAGDTGATGATGPAGTAQPSYGYARAANGTNLSPGGANTVSFGMYTNAGDVSVESDHIAVTSGVYQVTLSLRSESTNTAIWWVDTSSDYTAWMGSQLSFPAAASPSAAVTSSVTFVANVVTEGIFRPRYVSGSQANFRDIQLTVVKLGDIPTPG
ncbi:hypothetical protein FHU40_001709 [Nocardioides soli]|uniref:Collagen-like protein n=1 Tax=Nocardioides soli TaxID=1036020 RepID=A0A7W4VUS8_9ACTN|nr:hypothetical protein [Nocardioides soli]